MNVKIKDSAGFAWIESFLYLTDRHSDRTSSYPFVCTDLNVKDLKRWPYQKYLNLKRTLIFQ